MGLIKQAKESNAFRDAERARSDGNSVFVYRFEMPHTGRGFSGSVSGAAEVIMAIEAVGWRLEHISDGEGGGDRGAILMVFRPATAA